MFVDSKESRESKDPMYGLKTTDFWNPHDSVHGIFTRPNDSLKVQKRKLNAGISGKFSKYSEAESLEDALLDASNLCWENLNSNTEGLYCTLINATYGDNLTKT